MQKRVINGILDARAFCRGLRMVLVYIGLGANLGDPKKNIELALERLSKETAIWDLRSSPLYWTTPVSDEPQDCYVNCAAQLQTHLSASGLFSLLEEIERQGGKVAKGKGAPRPIDIDLLFYGQEKIKESSLEVPHPRLFERLFVLRPLRDLTRWIHLEEGPIDLDQLLDRFINRHNEVVVPL